MQSPTGGATGVRTQGRKGDDGSHTASPRPLQRDKCRASCLRRACDVLTPEDGQRGRPPPPPTPYSPTHPGKGRGQRGDGEGTWGGAEDRPTRREERRAAGGGKKKQSKPTRRGKKAGRQGPTPQRTWGGRGDVSPQETLVRYPTSGVRGPQRRKPPPPLQPSASPRACVLLA